MTQATSRKPNTNDQTIKAALALLASGHATMAEIADMAGTSRQLVRHWAFRAGIDPVLTRRQYLEREWAQALSVDSAAPR